MERLLRFALLVLALATGGLLGHVLLPGFRPLSLLLFLAACQVLGLGFSKLDRRICKGVGRAGRICWTTALVPQKRLDRRRSFW